MFLQMDQKAAKRENFFPTPRKNCQAIDEWGNNYYLFYR